MNIMRKTYFILSVLSLGLLSGCTKFLDKGPVSSVTPANAFSSASDLQIYVNSFYNSMLPIGTNIYEADNATAEPSIWGGPTDNTAGTAPSQYVFGTLLATNAPDVWNSTNYNGNTAAGGGMTAWAALRNVNYFLQNYNNPAIDLADRQNYSGIAHLFRAWFYYNMIKAFGSVPWYSTATDPSDTTLYKPQDPRTLVMDSVLADLNYATQNISGTKDATCTMASKWVAYALKARICLFEGTFRKYHTELSLGGTAAQWLQNAAGAADTLIASGQYKLHNTGNPTSDYRSLFISTTPSSDEVLLAVSYSTSLAKYNDANWWYTSPTYGARLSLTKSFVNTYLDIDGTRFTDKLNYDTMEFQVEVQNRDARLFQTIRMPPYTQDGTPAPPDFNYTYTGYEPLKWCLDNPANNSVNQNTNAIPILRYAEVLLDDAEAYAELGQMSAAIWNNTIGALRARAGITNTSMPVTADAYLQSAYYPDISDPVILEIRRERGVELSLEGQRYDDLRRWKEAGDLVKPYDGIYVPALNQLLDLNQDGKPDVCFVTSAPASKVAGVVYITIDNVTMGLSGGTSGNLLWLPNEKRVWSDFKYYFPITYSELQLDPGLVQNQGW
jgi:hypothetical protein